MIATNMTDTRQWLGLNGDTKPVIYNLLLSESDTFPYLAYLQPTCTGQNLQFKLAGEHWLFCDIIKISSCREPKIQTGMNSGLRISKQTFSLTAGASK